ncbi:Uncharacterised protein [Vibrio cholerae]|nr:Uncharacterised protein [Vibrio cholerae]
MMHILPLRAAGLTKAERLNHMLTTHQSMKMISWSSTVGQTAPQACCYLWHVRKV